MNKSTLAAMKGVHNPEKLAEQIRACVTGNYDARGYLNGAIQVLERNPPNNIIVPLLRRARDEFGRRKPQ